ncbi:MAG: Pr6Pr family membrane protein [Mucilaginibacter sp.]
MKAKIKLAYASVAAIIVWFGLGLQFYISVPAYMIKGYTFLGAVIQVLSYFTILTNILVALVYSYMVLSPYTLTGMYLSRGKTITATAVYITIVGFIYALVLRNVWNPQGLFKLADDLLHTVTPILFVLFWLIFAPKKKLKWSLMITWLIYPFIYLVYTLIRGQIVGTYPYNFMDINTLGVVQTTINCLLVLVAFLSFGAIFIAVSRFLNKSA